MRVNCHKFISYSTLFGHNATRLMSQNVAVLLHPKSQSDQNYYMLLSHYLHLHQKRILTNVKPNAFRLHYRHRTEDVCPARTKFAYQYTPPVNAFCFKWPVFGITICRLCEKRNHELLQYE